MPPRAASRSLCRRSSCRLPRVRCRRDRCGPKSGIWIMEKSVAACAILLATFLADPAFRSLSDSWTRLPFPTKPSSRPFISCTRCSPPTGLSLPPEQVGHSDRNQFILRKRNLDSALSEHLLSDVQQCLALLYCSSLHPIKFENLHTPFLLFPTLTAAKGTSQPIKCQQNLGKFLSAKIS